MGRGRAPTWTAVQEQEFLAEYVTGASWTQMAEKLNRGASGLQSRWHRIAAALEPDKAVALRKQRAAAVELRLYPHLKVASVQRVSPPLVVSLPQPLSLTAAIMGDPLPGRSALDRKAAGV